MSVAFIAPGRPLLAAPGQPVLWRALSSTPAATGTTTTSPGGAVGVSGWWDASTLAGLLGANGAPVPAWGSAVSAVADLSGSGRPLLPYAYAGGAVASAMPRVSGMLGGVGYNAATQGFLQPALSPDLGFQVGAVEFGPDTAWTRLLVWSRPNLRQDSGRDGAAIVLLQSGSMPVLSASSTVPGTLALWPSAGGPILTSALERRHTHAVLLRHTPGVGVDAWLDGTKVATGVANPMPAGAVTMTLLHDGTANGGAQCWLNECAMWEQALSDAEAAAVMQYAGRWALGPRKGISLIVNGQSNAINFVDNDGAASLMVQGIAWHLGALAWNLLASSTQTMVASHGLYAGLYGGSFLNDPGDGSDPSTWLLGADGLSDQAFLAAQSAADLADADAIFWFWSESDSARAYAEKATYKAAVQRFVALERAMVPGATAANLPHLWWNAMPFGLGTDGGTQMIRETMQELTVTAGYDLACVMPMTADSNPRGGTDGSHLDSIDNVRLGRLAAPVAAQALMAAGRGDSIPSLPPGLPQRGGPIIVHVYRETRTTLVVTVQHDAGDDLKLPGLAPQGAGFVVMDGGSVGSPGTLVPAVACSRIDPTHLQLTLAQPLVNPSSACSLFYPWGIGRIGRGNSVTDNWSNLSKPTGWDIAADLGSAWRIDFPLAATAQPAVLSDTP